MVNKTRRRQVLIVKTGFSEFLDLGISTTVSLGDVLICTSLLHLYKNDDVTWVTDWQARQLLKNNPYIKNLLIFGSSAFKTISNVKYDVLINLEKHSGICTFLSAVKATKKFGFYFNDKTYSISSYRKSAQYLLRGQAEHRDIKKNALEILYDTVGAKWKNQGLVLSLKKDIKVRHDIGFNHAVGTKWPTKAWPDKYWKELEGLLSDYQLSWQQGHKDLARYIDWIASCRLIVTSDSLGQAIGQALGKKVITLYGPTNYMRMNNIPNVTTIVSSLKCPHMPCFLPVCKHDKFCMDYIKPKEVALMCEKILSKGEA